MSLIFRYNAKSVRYKFQSTDLKLLYFLQFLIVYMHKGRIIYTDSLSFYLKKKCLSVTNQKDILTLRNS